MDSMLRAKVLTMAAATLGLSIAATGCSKKAAEPEGGAAASGSESSCGSGSCGAAKEGETTAPEGEGGGAAEGGGESSCGGGSCGSK
jgi:uncharacterized low-complexity protein